MPLTPAQAAAFARAHVVWTLDVPLDLPTVAPNLRFVQAMGSGVGQYVASRLPEGGILLANGAGIGAPPVAEWVLARTLQILKRLPEHDTNPREHRWETALGSNLQGRTVAIIGLGAIGREVARRMRAFGVHLLGMRRRWAEGLTDPDVDELFRARRPPRDARFTPTWSWWPRRAPRSPPRTSSTRPRSRPCGPGSIFVNVTARHAGRRGRAASTL